MATKYTLDLKDAAAAGAWYADSTGAVSYKATTDTVDSGLTKIATVEIPSGTTATIKILTSETVTVSATAANAKITEASISGGAAGSVYTLANVKGYVVGASGADTYTVDGDDTVTADGADTINVSSVGNVIKGDASKVYFTGITGITADSLGTDGKVGDATNNYTLAEPSADSWQRSTHLI